MGIASSIYQGKRRGGGRGGRSRERRRSNERKCKWGGPMRRWTLVSSDATRRHGRQLVDRRVKGARSCPVHEKRSPLDCYLKQSSLFIITSGILGSALFSIVKCFFIKVSRKRTKVWKLKSSLYFVIVNDENYYFYKRTNDAIARYM